MDGGSFVYRPGWLCAREAAALFETLEHCVSWRHEWLHLYGRRTAVPRLLAWFGDRGLNYRYSGADHPCEGWLPALEPLRRRLLEELDLCSNFVLVNRYRDGSDYMGWHADDERGLGPAVASVSLGSTRRFLLRVPDRARSLPLDLEHGSLLVFDGALRHSLPRSRRALAERINLTFRYIGTAAA